MTNCCSDFIDIPIGLKEKGSRERLCDLEARKLLKKRSASIFPAPSRPALDGDNYHHASQINYTSTGRKLSRQTWHLIHKIKEVDRFLTETKNCPVFHEFHPELGFLALNRFVPLSYSKKRAEGQRERLKILEEYFDKTPEMFNTALQRFLRKDVAADDILDGLAGALTARFNHRLVSLPGIPESDPKGLKMEIVYPQMENFHV